MSIKSGPRRNELIQALEVLAELKLPEHLQEAALKHLLSNSIGGEAGQPSRQLKGKSVAADSDTGDLRSFVAATNPKGAVSEIPLLLYWARKNEGLERATEKDVVELYRRAALRPPKDIVQSFRDLCSKKYMRLEVPNGERGYVRLARAGEDFVLHDLVSK